MESIIKTTLCESINKHDIMKTFRPQILNDYIGQEHIKSNLSIAIQAARNRNEPLDHLLFYGPPGLGKTTISNIIANEMHSRIYITSGPAIEKAGDLVSLLSNLNNKDILFIDEIHRIPKNVEEYLYSAMEDFFVNITVGSGPQMKSIKLDLPKFTLIGATTRAGMLSSPLRDRFGHLFHMRYYTTPELSTIVQNASNLLFFNLDDKSAIRIAKTARGTPRIALNTLKRVRDFSEVLYQGNLSDEFMDNIFTNLGIDETGLNEFDLQILSTIYYTFSNRPTGLSTLAASTGEDENTIKDVYEPYLIQNGFLCRTASGRVVTEKGIHLITNKKAGA